ncbi:unnamed protein product [Bursaphelenchus xylophilus]|uniref:(pine wood nematode) hypothetical protein n=1 Tax=Bursaphelenchus xylophilus TaxID=6326 RepID=A0A1I7SML7_BURXY|nr:unnamed protein product [Bursaphelenchus xylophilus]CAG9130277.1 unnamed protein product [Bursaphelenchus xylophilus]
MDFIHCNICFEVPKNGGRTFFLTSCGHIVCAKCVKKNKHTTTPSRSEVCRTCKSTCDYSEINRNLDGNSKMFFQSPKDLAAQYMINLKKVLEFQSYHRSRFFKYQTEKMNYLNKYAKAAQTEIKKRQENEKKILTEKEKLRNYCKERAQQCQELEEQLSRCKEELILLSNKYKEENNHRKSSRERERSATPKRSQNNQFPQLYGDTPITTLSMGCTTSTPNDPCFLNANPNAISPMFQESPVVACGGDYLTTPALLGLPKTSQRRSLGNRAEMPTPSFFHL